MHYESTEDNIIWVLCGDIKAEDYKETYRKLGAYLKSATPDKLITFHPFWKMFINNVYRRT
ncbi:DUF4038 domain-containing protein [Lachnospira eligens]|uniref:DUF4038 domain-containing protein n=1 Tax=Lachnospira eligens TaxID=39485 RepID=A0A413YQ97_9FIRM|nr:DUF4038 domain-containing protein [Lachnospira eligens]RHC11231.1 DUF4038 domain-containing protein [Lachnospira eligens]RHM14038.1 DUF4038 domain-containing protein [Lachnospira eligens]